MVLKNTRSPGLQVFLVDLLGGRRLFVGAARQHQADGLLVHGAHEAAAVETGFGRVAAALVGHAQETHGRDDQVGSAIGDGDRTCSSFVPTCSSVPPARAGEQALFGHEAARRPLRPGRRAWPGRWRRQRAKIMMSHRDIARRIAQSSRYPSVTH